MNRDQVQERIKALQEEAKRLESAHMQVSGALADCNYWLSKLLEEESNAVSEKHDS